MIPTTTVPLPLFLFLLASLLLDPTAARTALLPTTVTTHSPTIPTSLSPTSTSTTAVAAAAPPACAAGCLTSALSSIGCALLDFKCICSDTSFLSRIACCSMAICSGPDQVRTLIFGTEFCFNVGIMIPIIDDLKCSSVVGVGNSTVPPTSSSTSLESESTTVTSKPANVTSTTTATAAAAAATTSTSYLPPPAHTSLPTPATAGIAVGASVIGVALIALIFLVFRRRRARAARGPTPVVELSDLGEKKDVVKPGGELGGMPVSELEGSGVER